MGIFVSHGEHSPDLNQRIITAVVAVLKEEENFTLAGNDNEHYINDHISDLVSSLRFEPPYTEMDALAEMHDQLRDA